MTNETMKCIRTLFLALILLAVTACQEKKQNTTIGSSPEVERRVEKILARMTLAEKIGQMNQVSVGGDVSNYADALRKGQIGSILNEVDPVKINEFQRICVEESRLGIPLLVGRDVIHGYHTVFPIPLGLAATFDPELVEQGARVAALFGAVACHEDRIEPEPEPRLNSVTISTAKLVLPAEGSVEIPFRVEDPGYVFNYSADDPKCQVQLKGKDGKTPAEFRISRIIPGAEPGLYTAVLTDLGVSTDYVKEVRLLVENTYYLSSVTYMPSQYFGIKHFVGYGAAEGGRDYNSTYLTERQLRNVYLPPFQAAVEAGAMTLMTSFNDNDGVPSTGNTFVVKDVLRGEWGFDGLVVTDWNSMGEMINHGFGADRKEVARKALEARFVERRPAREGQLRPCGR